MEAGCLGKRVKKGVRGNVFKNKSVKIITCRVFFYVGICG